MTKQDLINSLNNMGQKLNIDTSIFPKKENDMWMAPVAMQTIAQLMWVKQIPDDEDSNRIREQLKNLWEKGQMIYD